MSQTVIRGTQILNNTVQRQDLDTSTVGQAVVTKIIQGGGITLSSTGADSGTGDVTVTSPDVVSTDAGNIATLGTDNHILVPQSQIWSVRLRSFQALGNNTFEVDARTVGTGPSASGTFALDRWFYNKTGTMTFSTLAQQDASASPVLVPGTSFAISRSYLRLTVGTQQASLAATDKAQIYQQVEAPQLRELISDVHSIQVLARSSVAGLSFGVSLRDASTVQSLTLLATLPTPNVWTLLKFQNLPVWPAGATWSLNSGVQGYYFTLCFAAGSSFTAPSNSVWNAGNFIGAAGQSNFSAQAVGSTVDIAYAGHEPGAVCSTPIDCPFTQNYDDCLRYFQKTYSYATAVGAATFAGDVETTALASQNIFTHVPFKRIMAKTPTMTLYSASAPAVNTVFDVLGALNRTTTGARDVGETGFGGASLTTPSASAAIYAFHYTADTGW